MEMKFSTGEKMVGAFLVSTAILIIGSLILIGRGKTWFTEHAYYRIIFDEGYNLREGATVKILNTDVGSVISIRITPQNKVGVKIRILKSYSGLIRRDSVAVVDSPTVIGSEYLSITAGSLNIPSIPEEGVIPSRRKKSLGDYAEEFHLEEKFKTMARILTGVEQIVNQLKDPNGPLVGTLGNLRGISNDIKDGKGMGRLLVKDDFYEDLDRQMTHLEDILTDIQKTSKAVEQTSQSLPQVVKDVREIVDDIKATSRDIRATAEDIKAAGKNIKAGSEDVPPVTRSVRDSLRKIDQILESAKRNPLIKGGIPEQGKGVVEPDMR